MRPVRVLLIGLLCLSGVLGCQASMQDVAISTVQSWQEGQCRKDPTIPCPSSRVPGASGVQNESAGRR